MAYEYQAWPAWCHGPNSESAIFQCEEDVPKGWTHHGETVGRKKLPQIDHDGDGRAGGSRAPGEDVKALRTAYKAKFGKRAFNGWDAATLQEKLDAREE